MKKIEIVETGSANSVIMESAFTKVLEEYDKSEVIMGETLSSIGVNNISLEGAFKLYCYLMNFMEGDQFVRIYDNNVEDLLDDAGIDFEIIKE